MQVALADRDKQSMLFMGGELNFNYDNPGPVEVEVSTLTTEQKNQLLYNFRQGIVTVDSEQELLDSCSGFPAASTSFATPKERPIVNTKPPSDALEKVAKERKKLKKLLKGHHATVRKETSNMSPSQIKELVTLEKEGKKRKGLVEFFIKLLEKHEKAVSKATGGIDLVDIPGVFAKNEMIKHSQNLTSIVESEEEEITLIPSDKELEAANG